MRKLGILVMAMVLVCGMSLGVMAADFEPDVPVEDDYDCDIGQDQTIGTSVAVNPFASFVYEGQRDKFPTHLFEEIDPNIVDEYGHFKDGDGLAGDGGGIIDDNADIIAIDQYKWTLRANTSTQTNVETTTDSGLADNVNIFYEFSSEHDDLNNPEWVRYLNANDSETFGEQESGMGIGYVMVAMDANDYLENWTDVEATEEDDPYDMSVTFTISEY